MRLTNRGRVVVGVTVTVLVIAGQRVTAAGGNGSADAAARPAAGTSVAEQVGERAPAGSALPSASAVPSGSAVPSPSAVPSGSAVPSASAVRSESAVPSPGVRAGVPAGTGQLVSVSTTSGVGGTGPLRRYRVQVEGGLGEDPDAFAAAVQETLTDRRSWGARLAFQRVPTGPVAFTVVLASPRLTDELCRPLRTLGRLSCHQGGRSIVNLARWRGGADAYGADLAGYRRYVVNHEVGHALGHAHEPCPAAGALAPVMMQQTKGIGACRPNPWPYPG